MAKADDNFGMLVAAGIVGAGGLLLAAYVASE